MKTMITACVSQADEIETFEVDGDEPINLLANKLASRIIRRFANKEARTMGDLQLQVIEGICICCGYPSNGSSGFISCTVPMCSECNREFFRCYQNGDIGVFTFENWVLERREGVANGDIQVKRAHTPRTPGDTKTKVNKVAVLSEEW